MYKSLILILLSKNINCFYEEIESVSTTSAQPEISNSGLDPRKYYWFEFEDEIWMTYFENSSDYHKDPFILFFLVPGAKNEDWPHSNNYALLLDTLWNFHQTSAFISLLSNKQETTRFKFSITILDKDLDVEFDLGETLVFLLENIELYEIVNYSQYLDQVKVGTIYWSQFYKAEDGFFGLFLETYYIAYLQDLGGTYNSSVANLSRVAYFMLKTSSIGGKDVLIEKVDFSAPVSLQKNLEPQIPSWNLYYIFIFYPTPTYIETKFNLNEDCTQKIEVSSEDIELKETIKEPQIERLRQTGNTLYSFSNVKIEVPVFFFGKQLLVSRLFFVVKLKLARSDEESAKLVTSVEKYDFYEKGANRTAFNLDRRYFVYFTYVIENESIIFQIAKVTDSDDKPFELNKIAVTNSNRTTNVGDIISFINGAIICVENKLVELKEAKIDSNNIKSVVLLCVGLFLIVFLLIISGWLIYYKRKKLKKKRVRTKMKT